MRKRKNEVEHDEFLTKFIEMTNWLDKAACENNLHVRDAIREMNSYQEEIKMNQEGIEELEQQVAENESELQKHDEFMKKRENELETAKMELESAKRKVNTLERSLSEAKKFHNNLETEKNDIQLLIEKQKKFGERLSRIVLLHKSSEKIKRKINNYQLGIMVVNICDNNGYIKDVVKPDIIVKPEEAVNFFMRVPYNFEEKYSEKEKESILAYCSLVMNVVSHMDDYSRIKLLYCNEDIAKILKMNGVGA
ncbi:MAG: hypothetical protein V8R39_05640 [Clostridia bacterium]